MNDAERIRALLEQGRIDERQAQRLLEALGSEGTSEAPHDSAAHDAAHNAGTNQDTDAAGAAGTPSAGATASSGSSATRQASAVSDAATRWLTVRLMAADLTVRGGEVEAPTMEGDTDEVTLEEKEDGWLVRAAGSDGAGGFEGWLNRIGTGPRLTVTVPRDTGLRLNLKAGDVDVHDVPALSGSLAAGDVDAHGLRALDLDVRAGDVDAELDPLPGRHRVTLTAGDVDLVLPATANATIDGRVSIGACRGTEPLRSERTGLGAKVTGTLGRGGAQVEARIRTGELKVRTA